MLLEREDVDPDSGVSTAEHRCRMLLFMGNKGWQKYCSGGTTLAPTHRIASDKHRSGVLLQTGMMKW